MVNDVSVNALVEIDGYLGEQFERPQARPA